MTEWSVRIELAGGFIEEDADRVTTILAKSSPATGFGPGELDVQFCVEAGNAQDAIKKGTNLLMSALKKPARVVSVEALSMEDLDRSIAESNAPDFVGVSELAGILRVSKQRISKLASAPEFPKPIAILAAGPIWRKTTIARFAEAWERRPGRPRKGAITASQALRVQTNRVSYRHASINELPEFGLTKSEDVLMLGSIGKLATRSNTQARIERFDTPEGVVWSPDVPSHRFTNYRVFVEKDKPTGVQPAEAKGRTEDLQGATTEVPQVTL